MPPSLSNNVIKLLGVRVPVIANFYDPTIFLFVKLFLFPLISIDSQLSARSNHDGTLNVNKR